MSYYRFTKRQKGSRRSGHAGILHTDALRSSSIQFTHMAGVTVSNFGLGSTFAILAAIGYSLFRSEIGLQLSKSPVFVFLWN